MNFDALLVLRQAFWLLVVGIFGRWWLDGAGEEELG